LLGMAAGQPEVREKIQRGFSGEVQALTAEEVSAANQEWDAAHPGGP